MTGAMTSLRSFLNRPLGPELILLPRGTTRGDVLVHGLVLLAQVILWLGIATVIMVATHLDLFPEVQRAISIAPVREVLDMVQTVAALVLGALVGRGLRRR